VRKIALAKHGFLQLQGLQETNQETKMLVVENRKGESF